tara:strand:- start:1468 stop:1704 length:237 start_codon:yes stop_codon:yes gene_type:complete
MSSFARKLRRKGITSARKQFMKEFKKTMRKFKKLVKCSLCGREPVEGEKIDNWRINQESENIDLICPDCYTEEETDEV